MHMGIIELEIERPSYGGIHIATDQNQSEADLSSPHFFLFRSVLASSPVVDLT